MGHFLEFPSGKYTKNYGKSPFLMGKSTINSHFHHFPPALSR
jgi:hypothetical protein